VDLGHPARLLGIPFIIVCAKNMPFERSRSALQYCKICQIALQKPTMKDATKRSILRWIHIVFAIPIAGYVYSPFEELPNYAPVVRFISIPVLVLSGFWMWKGHVIRRLLSRIGKT